MGGGCAGYDTLTRRAAPGAIFTLTPAQIWDRDIGGLKGPPGVVNPLNKPDPQPEPLGREEPPPTPP